MPIALVLALATSAAAAPLVRFESSGRLALTATGNTLGLSGDEAGPAAIGRIGAFIDADEQQQVAGWPLGTADDWTLASSDAVLDLPAGAHVAYAELVWGGSLGNPVLGLLDGPVRLTTPTGAIHLLAPDPTTASTTDGTMAGAGYYARSAVVTTVIEGGGRYRVSGVPSTLGPEAAAGWTLYVVYRHDALALRRVALVLLNERVAPDGDPALVTGTLGGLCLHQNAADREALVILTAMDGDADVRGDTFRFARNASGLDGSGARLGSAVAPVDNVFGGHITLPGGAIDRRGSFGDANHAANGLIVAGRQGWDLVNLDGSSQLASNWSSAFFRVASDEDPIALLAVGLSLSHRGPFLVDDAQVLTATPLVALPGEVVSLSAVLHQDGDATATGVRFTLPDLLPAGVSYVPESFLVDGAPALAGPVRTEAELLAGVEVGNLASGATAVVTFEVAIAQGVGLTQWAFAPRVTYGNLACAGAATSAWQPTPIIVRLGSCGDGAVDGVEACDDGNAAAADGCTPGCAVEYGWTCQGPAGTSNHCSTLCGDGRLAAPREACDDGDALGGDGCAPDCRVERGWACDGAAIGAGSPDDPDSACASHCGDGIIADPVEACDDGDADPFDGCSALCLIEVGWTCARSTSGPPDSVCSASCGDGHRDAGEGCDDGGFTAGDGCSPGCLVERGWSCPGPVGVVSVCAEVCGDGRVVGAEVCDDGRVSAVADGCARDCRSVDHGWRCEGVPSLCVTTCGDGLIGADAELCDDGNAEAGDGCAATCNFVEPGWSCGDPPQEPSVCGNACGDGYLRLTEGCDDGNVGGGDGCAADCRQESGWQCRQLHPDVPTVCQRDTDEDGQLDDGDESGDPSDNPCPEGRPSRCDDNCPELANPDQTFPTGAEATWLCPPYDGPRTQGGGGCSAGGGSSLLFIGLLALVGARRRLARHVVAFVALGLAPRSSDARAQEVDPRLFEPALSPRAVLGVDSSATPGHLEPWLTALVDLVDDELITRIGPDATSHGPLEDRLILTLGGGLGLFDRFEVALALPIIATTLGPGAAGEGTTGLGDVRLVVRGRLLGSPWGTDGAGLALALQLGLPTGSADFMSDGGVTAMPQLIADYRSARGLVIALNLGYRMRPERVIDDLAIDDELRLGLGAELPVGFEGLSFTAEVLASSGLGASPHDDGGVALREVPVEALGGLRWRTRGGLCLTGAAGSGLTEGYGAPDFRMLLALSWNGPAPAPYNEPLVSASKIVRRDPWDDAPAARPPPPREELPAETFDQVAAVDPDADGDGIPVPGDQCPDGPEDLDGWLDGDGCYDPDNDLDGILDRDDKCPNSEEIFNGFEDLDGCSDIAAGPVAAPVGFVGRQIKIPDRIRFVSGSAELLDSDKRIIETVAGVMRANPTIKRFRIEGHTDNLGDREFNVDLAERRAWSVRAYLIELGIDDKRLFAKGFGSTRPVAPNGTEAGRAQNRRVEFHALADGEPVEGLPAGHGEGPMEGVP